MWGLFGEVKALIKLDKICIDNNVFRLHYKATFIVLLVSGILVTSKQYIGDPIDCIVEGVPDNVMDTYCWIHSTFSVSSAVVADLGTEVAHPGVAPPADEEIRYHKYYQWVCFTLFFQAILFYIPRYLWKVWEAGKLKFLVSGITMPIVDPPVKEERTNALLNYFDTNRNKTKHAWYATKLFFCEFLNFANVIFQIFFVDFFLGGEFSTYGSEVWGMMEQNPEERTDPMAKVFPKMAKCTFHKFGPSGTIQKFDGLCILPVNIINEKIYFFLWFWLIILAIVTFIQQIYRVMSIFLPAVKQARMKALCRSVTIHKIQDLAQKSSIGDWFLLCQLGKNIDPIIFRDFIEKLADQ